MIISRTPFRISLFGGGTDYPIWFKEHGGATLGFTIDKYCYITARYLPPFFPHKTRIVYSKEEWVNYHAHIQHPAVRECLRYLDIRNGVEICHMSDLLARKGLGASSSFVVGLLNALSTLSHQGFSKMELAQMAVLVEQEKIEEHVGCQDQYLSALGGLNRLQFNQDGIVGVTPLPISAELWRYLMLFDTGTTRVASEIAKSQIEATPSKVQELSMMQSYVDIAVGLLKNDKIEELGRLLHESWLLKKSLTKHITTPEIEVIYETARKAGAIGGKILGAGGGGYMVLIAELANHANIEKALYNLKSIPVGFDQTGTQIIFNDEKEKIFV